MNCAEEDSVKEVHTESNGYASVREVECAQGLSEKIKKATTTIIIIIILWLDVLSTCCVYMYIGMG